MYKIIVNDNITAQGDGSFAISPVLTEKVGCAGSLVYSVAYDDHNFGVYQERVTTAAVYEEGVTDPIWAGRLLTTDKDFYNTMELTFEGELAYLNDVQYPPYDFAGDIPDLVKAVLEHYNSKCSTGREITLGTITVEDPNKYITRSNQEYSSCWAVFSEKLAKLCGGYFKMRYQGGVRYLDYLTDPGVHNTQQMKFGSNLLDLEHYIDATDLATVIIPQGAELEDDEGTSLGRLTIETASQNTSGLDYYETELVDPYGRIEIVVQWDDVTVADNLYTKAVAYAQTMVEKAVTITAKVVDLHLTDAEIESLNCGDYIECVSEPHKMSLTLMLSERKRNLNDPSSDTITLGNIQQTFTESATAIRNADDEDKQEQKRYNANLAQRIQNAKGMYTSTVTDESGAEVIWIHDQQKLGDSQCIVTISAAGVHMSGDGGASWYGADYDGEFLMRLVEAYQISADRIYGGTLASIAVDNSGQPITYIDMDNGEVAKLGNIGWIKRASGNESLKWMGDK